MSELPMSSLSLSGKTALVTGGSRGIGRQVALTLAARGANVAVTYVGGEAAAAETVVEAHALGVKAVAYRCDASQYEAAQQLIADVILEFGGLDILVNNAGITRDNLAVRMTEEEFDDVIAVNLKGTFATAKFAAAHMMRARTGRIINISSVSGLMGNAGQANYAAAKAGVIGMTKSMARELAPRGVTVNAVAPGFITTDMTDKLSENVCDQIKGAIPMRRFGAVEDIAETVAFLASDAAGYITGETIRVDGGMAM